MRLAQLVSAELGDGVQMGLLKSPELAQKMTMNADLSMIECTGTVCVATAHICGIPGTARPPADPNVSRGFVRKDGRALHAAAPPGRDPASHYILFQVPARSETVPALPRAMPPLQCCHATSYCRGPSRCSRCGGAGHESASCSAAAAHCTNCGGKHAVDNPRCPRWQQERQVATAILQSTEEELRLAVRAKIRAEEAAKQPMIAPASNRQKRSYADAAKQHRILKQKSMNAEKQGTQPQCPPLMQAKAWLQRTGVEPLNCATGATQRCRLF
ncbi:hypothetical protein HPB48_001605 [Haemaphysalis longicornis]|uniref:CCHC-type domain-containing protein n=1 Tax=Haemaphysalis longicornis TaxID=44386 RepID=A0A9J6F6T6_HAELO|nr:hypothetical protein HPB48_001605 [Haemaphysalis longicornis]